MYPVARKRHKGTRASLPLSQFGSAHRPQLAHLFLFDFQAFAA